ncbi:MAG: NUDIX domain-containing protein [Patescibacteria group bacterium]|nr:NUDIX domain-containing protein [Patescibacteria group bacterium]
MTVPWAKMPDGEILVGLVHEHRPNMGPVKTLSPPGGFVDAGESREQAQRRESVEEGGLDTGGAVPLPGLPVNSDRLYLVQDATKDEGMHMYHIEVAFDRLEQVGPSLWRPKKDVIRHKKESDLYFHPWREAVDLSADALGLAAIAKLMTILI